MSASHREDHTTATVARPPRRRWIPWAYAAVVLLVVGLGAVTVFGQDIRHLLGYSIVCHVGETAVQANQRSGVDKASTRKVLKNFATDSHR